MKQIMKLFSCLLLLLVLALPAMATEVPSEVTLFKNVNVFDGHSEKLLEDYDVLVVGNLIKQVGKDIPTSGTYELEVTTGRVQKIQTLPGACLDHYHVIVTTEEGKTETKEVKVKVIDGAGRTLMPGLIDAHWHTMMSAVKGNDWQTDQLDYTHAAMVVEARKVLMRGFTTVRDTGGPGFGIKKAIDEGLIEGPRMFLSGRLISQSSGHADRTQVFEQPRIFAGGQVPMGEGPMGMDRVANGRAEVLTAVRQNLKEGATQIKITLGGGVYSVYDPLDVNEFTADEVQAAVDATSDWGTYVTAHVYQDEGIKRAIDHGVQCIEHGQLMSEATAKLMADKGIWLVTQPFEYSEEIKSFATPLQWAKYMEVVDGWKKTAEYLKKHKVKMGYGTDLVFTPQNNDEQQAGFLARFSKWFSNVEMLRMITSNNGELLAMSGKRVPYQDGPLGVIKEGAYADIILVDGNPLDDVKILGDGGKNFPLIMKDGKIYKNTLK